MQRTHQNTLKLHPFMKKIQKGHCRYTPCYGNALKHVMLANHNYSENWKGKEGKKKTKRNRYRLMGKQIEKQ